MRTLLLLIGCVLILLSLFAYNLGIDNDPGWGKGRLFLLLAGVLLTGPGVLSRLAGARWLPTPLRVALQTAGARLRGWVCALAHSSALTLLLTVLICAVLAAYGGWMTSGGRFPTFTRAGGHYPMLAEGFLHGRLSLLEQPDPKLLALPDPYSFGARNASGAKVLWDASLYNGQYYIYWGPVPALILAGVWALSGQVPSTAAADACFFAGLVILLAMLFYRIRRRFYPHAPGVSIAFFLTAAALNLHTLWLVGRPSTYETAILSGQFFLFLGLLFWLLYLENARAAWLPLAGLSWGLAVGSRNPLIISVGVYALFAALRLWRTNDRKLSRLFWGRLAALFAPLAACGLGLLAYNYARFGSLTETGIGYQLTLWVDPQNYFSPVYAPSNLYMWLFYPYTISEAFPFFHFIKTVNLQFPAWATRPPFQMFDREFYSFLSVPLVWLLALGLPLLAWRTPRGKAQRTSSTVTVAEKGLPPVRVELTAIMAAAALAQFGLLMCFFYAATRYGAEINLPIALLAALICWEADARLANRPALRGVLWTLAGMLALLTAVIGFFASFYVPEGFFQKLSPALYVSLAERSSVLGRYAAGILRLVSRPFGH